MTARLFLDFNCRYRAMSSSYCRSIESTLTTTRNAMARQMLMGWRMVWLLDRHTQEHFTQFSILLDIASGHSSVIVNDDKIVPYHYNWCIPAGKPSND